MSPKLKRLFAVETMKATVPELFAKVKKAVDFDESTVLDEYELVEQKHGKHRSVWSRIVFLGKDGIQYRITVAGLYKHDIDADKEQQ